MAFNLGDIFVTFKAKTDDLNNGVTRVKSSIAEVERTVNRSNFKQFSSNASTAFGGVANAIQGVITKAAIFATTSSLGIGAFVKSAADLQIASKSFEILIGNADRANQLFADLKQFADQTPFEFPELARSARTLLGYGIGVEDVMKRVKMLGDIAAVTGADFNQLSVVFGQVNGAGRLMGQDALQLINNNIPVTTILTKKLGITAKELRNRIEEGAISSKIFTEALVEYTSKGGPAFQGTEVLAKTLNGRLSTLKDTVMEFGRNLIGVKVDPELGLVIEPGGLFDRFSKVVPRITASLKELGPKVSGIFQWIFDHGDTVKAVLAGIAAAFVTAKVAAIGFAIAANLNPFSLIATAIVAVVAALTYLQVKFNWIGKIMAVLQPIFKAAGDIFNKYLKPAFEELGKVIMEELWPALQELWKQLAPVLMPILKTLGVIIGAVIIGAILGLAKVLKFLIPIFTAVIEKVSVGIRVFSGWIANAKAGFDRFKDALELVVMWVRDKINRAVATFQSIKSKIGSALSGVFDTITRPFRNAFNRISQLWNSTVGKLSFKMPGWIPGIGGKGFSMPKLPQLASGIENFGGGWAVVGERGPELAYLPRGSSVYSNEKSRTMLNNTSIYGDINIASDVDADNFLRRLSRDQELESMGLSPA